MCTVCLSEVTTHHLRDPYHHIQLRLKFASMSTLRVFALAFACAVSCVYGDFTLTGVCPDGRQAGERWVPKEDPCSECSCNHLGWGCDSCPILTPIIGCYPVQAAVLPYPECCPRLVCPPFQP